jgi:hypothetical protein
MTVLTYEILAETLFSGEIAGDPGGFAKQIDHLFETMGRVDPLDLLRAPTGCRGSRACADAARRIAYFRRIVADTMAMREARLKTRARRARRLPDAAPARRRPGRADARGDRGQHHHLHRRRPRDDGARARLDALLPGRGALGARADRGRDRRGAGARAATRRNGSTPCR